MKHEFLTSLGDVLTHFSFFLLLLLFFFKNPSLSRNEDLSFNLPQVYNSLLRPKPRGRYHSKEAESSQGQINRLDDPPSEM